MTAQNSKQDKKTEKQNEQDKQNKQNKQDQFGPIETLINTHTIMKKSLIMLLAATGLCSCAGNGYTVSGTLENPGDSVYLLTADTSREVIAADRAAGDGSFQISGDCEQPAMALLANSEMEPLGLLFLEKGKITVTENDGEIEAAGTPSNDAVRTFQQEIGKVRQEFFTLGDAMTEEMANALQNRADSLIRTAIENNADNLFGAYMLASNYYQMESDQVKTLIDKFSPEMRRTEYVAEVEKVLAAKANTEVGKPYIELRLNDINENPVALSSLIGEGRWVLVDFWATWCGPCKREIPHLIDAYKAYHDKGFEIYGVSLDNDTEAWKNYIAEHSISWVNVLGAGSDAASAETDKYAVQSIPSNFLISPEGTIVATNLRGEDLQTKLSELLD